MPPKKWFSIGIYSIKRPSDCLWPGKPLKMGIMRICVRVKKSETQWPFTGVSRALRARNREKVWKSPKKSPGPESPKNVSKKSRESGESLEKVPKKLFPDFLPDSRKAWGRRLRETFLSDFLGVSGPEGPRDPCKWSTGSQVQNAYLPNGAYFRRLPRHPPHLCPEASARSRIVRCLSSVAWLASSPWGASRPQLRWASWRSSARRCRTGMAYSNSVLTKWGFLWIHGFWWRAVFILRKWFGMAYSNSVLTKWGFLWIHMVFGDGPYLF